MMTQQAGTYRVILVLAILLLATCAAWTVDVPLAVMFRDCHDYSRSPIIAGWIGYFNFFETFGHGFGVVVLVFALHQLDASRRWAIPRVLACAFGAGGLANLLKMIIHRTRPYECALDGTVWDTFGTWFPMIHTNSGSQSFPSAHTATAVGFAAALIWLYPQGRLLFSLLAVLVAIQRVECGAHYLSDVFLGAAAGYLVAQLLLYIGYIPHWFDRLESNWKSGPRLADGCSAE